MPAECADRRFFLPPFAGALDIYVMVPFVRARVRDNGGCLFGAAAGAGEWTLLRLRAEPSSAYSLDHARLSLDIMEQHSISHPHRVVVMSSGLEEAEVAALCFVRAKTLSLIVSSAGENGLPLDRSSR